MESKTVLSGLVANGDGLRSIGVAEVHYEPGNGYRYVVVRASLPREMAGGHPDTHAVVSVLSPFQSAYVVDTRGYLAEYYVLEKFCSGHPQATFHAEPLTAAIGRLLCRPTEYDPAPVEDDES